MVTKRGKITTDDDRVNFDSNLHLEGRVLKNWHLSADHRILKQKILEMKRSDVPVGI